MIFTNNTFVYKFINVVLILFWYLLIKSLFSKTPIYPVIHDQLFILHLLACVYRIYTISYVYYLATVMLNTSIFLRENVIHGNLRWTFEDIFDVMSYVNWKQHIQNDTII